MTDTRETRRGDEATETARGGVCPRTEREPMTHPRRLLSVLSCIALAYPLASQERVAEIVAQDEPAPLLVSIDFPGGTVAEFVVVVRHALPPSKDPRADVNLLVGQNSANVTIPPMTVRLVELETLFNAANALLTPRYYLEVDHIDSGNGTPVMVVRATSTNEPATTRVLRVLPLRALTQTVGAESNDLALPPESILTAVQAALELVADDGVIPATVRFHESSGLLLVHGTTLQVETASDVVNQMERDLESLRRRARAGLPNLSTLLSPADPAQRNEGTGR